MAPNRHYMERARAVRACVRGIVSAVLGQPLRTKCPGLLCMACAPKALIAPPPGNIGSSQKCTSVGTGAQPESRRYSQPAF